MTGFTAWVAAAHLAAVAAYAGFQWTVRVLVYPQFASVGDRGRRSVFPATSDVTSAGSRSWSGPLFAALVATTAAVVLTRPGSVFAWSSAAATATVLGVTAFGAVPEHGRLARGWDRAAYRRLLRLDDIRVCAGNSAARVCGVSPALTADR